MVDGERYDAHAQPPDGLRAVFKKWQQSPAQEIINSPEILDLRRPNRVDRVTQVDLFSDREAEIQRAIHDFLGHGYYKGVPSSQIAPNVPFQGYEVNALPGLFIFPSLLCTHVQWTLLDMLLHRHLSDPQHNTNVHLFHHLVYPGATAPDGGSSVSFFAMDANHQLLPKDASTHKPMTVGRMLQRKLRWLLLGGQYDWTAKSYPQQAPPAFPTGLGRLLKAFFPNVEAEAAIINLYSPGDTLSVHRDVSEECDRGLISISIGCDCLFLVGSGDMNTHTTIHLRSGDAVLMTRESRFVWHGVPKILTGTCPESLESWPDCKRDARYEPWKGWMKSKRININVRQMKESGIE